MALEYYDIYWNIKKYEDNFPSLPSSTAPFTYNNPNYEYSDETIEETDSSLENEDNAHQTEDERLLSNYVYTEEKYELYIEEDIRKQNEDFYAYEKFLDSTESKGENDASFSNEPNNWEDWDKTEDEAALGNESIDEENMRRVNIDQEELSRQIDEAMMENRLEEWKIIRRDREIKERRRKDRDTHHMRMLIIRRCNACNDALFSFQSHLANTDKWIRLKEKIAILKHRHTAHKEERAYQQLLDLIVSVAVQLKGRRSTKTFELILSWIKSDKHCDHNQPDDQSQKKKNKKKGKRKQSGTKQIHRNDIISRDHEAPKDSRESCTILRTIQPVDGDSWTSYNRFFGHLQNRLRSESRFHRNVKDIVALLKHQFGNANNHRTDATLPPLD